MPKTTSKTEIKLTVNIRLGPATTAQKSLYRLFWAKVISQVKDELEDEC